jgi:hypothetical protein
VEKYGTAGQAIDNNIIRRMRFACDVNKETNTLRIRNTYCFSTTTVVTRTRLNITLYVHCLSCLHYMYAVQKLFPVNRITGIPKNLLL